jgi:predicted ATPase
MLSRQHPTNLAPELSSFIGREGALAEIARAFGDGARLVTIFGAPGTGKTRLARRCAATHVATVGSAWFCDLTAARSRADIVTAVGSALDVPLTLGATEEDAIAQLGHALAARGSVLVVLDNFEQVVAHVASTVGVWLEQAQNARVLATSREILGVEGEARVELAPLEAADAAALFVARARQAGRRGEPTSADREHVAEIVARLDGIPLAIELAASRASILSFSQIRDRLAQRLEWLRTDRRDVAERHTTLRGAIEWSWSLLTEDEKSALCQCAAFRRSFSLEAAEAIVRLPTGKTAVIDAIQSLRNKSLLCGHERSDPATAEAEEGTPAEPRFDLYETIRDFALDRAEQDPDLRSRHVAFYRRRGELWAGAAHGADGAANRARLGLERDNLIAAHSYCLENDLPAAVAFILILEPLFSTRGPLGVFLALVDASLEVADAAGDLASAACLLRVRAEVERQRGGAVRAQRDLERALAAARSCASERGGDGGGSALEGEIQGLLGVVHWQRRAVDDSEACTQAALAIHRARGNRRLEGMALGQLGLIAGFRQSFDEASDLLARARAIEREEGDRRYEGITAYFLAATIFEHGDLDRARRAYDEALVILREDDNRRYEGITLYAIGLLEEERGRYTESLASLERALAILQEVGDKRLEGVVRTGFGHHHFGRRAFEEAIGHYGEGARILQQVGGDARHEGLAVGYAGAAAASLDRVEDACVGLASARALLLHIGDASAVQVIDVLQGFVDLALGRSARSRGDAALAASHDADAARRLGTKPSPIAMVRVAIRVLKRAIDAGGARVVQEPAAGDAGVLEVSRRGDWFKRADGERVDLARRPKLRLLLEALIEKRLTSPGDPATAEWLIARVWPGERILPEACASRLYVAIATVRKLGLHDVLVTRTDGYLLHPAVSLRADDAI